MGIFNPENLRKVQRAVNVVFVNALCWIIGYVIGLNVARHFVPDFYLADVEGDTIISFLFATLALVIMEIIRERRTH